jgi:hypothetical protein
MPSDGSNAIHSTSLMKAFGSVRLGQSVGKILSILPAIRRWLTQVPSCEINSGSETCTNASSTKPRVRKLDMAARNPIRCFFDVRGIPAEVYRLPNDGRKWLVKAKARREIAMQLASYADADGTDIKVGATRMRDEIGGMCRSTLFNRLAELDELGFLITKGKTSEHGTAIRRLNVDAMLAKMAEFREAKSTIGDKAESRIEGGKVQDSLGKVQDSHLPESRIGQAKSRIDEAKSSLGVDPTEDRKTEKDTEDPATKCSLIGKQVKAPIAEREIHYEPQVKKLYGQMRVDFYNVEKSQLKISNKQKANLFADINEFGEAILPAWSIYLKQMNSAHPWPAFDFIGNVAGYIAEAAAKVEGKPKYDPSQIKESYAIARKQHEQMFGEIDHREQEASAESMFEDEPITPETPKEIQ